MPTSREYLTCLIRERLRTEVILRPWLAKRFGLTWRDICNRIDNLQAGPDGVSRFVNATDSSYLKVAELFPEVGGRILERALAEYPIRMRKTPVAIGMSNPDISVIIPFSGNDRLPQLQAVLDTFYAQDTPSMEIILVQGAGEVDTRLCLEPCVRTVRVDEPSGSHFNKSRLFNVGVREARAPYLLLHDADIAVPEDYVSTCLMHFRQNWEAFSPIRFLFYLTESQTATVIESKIISELREVSEIRQSFAGGSVAIERQAFDVIGGFDETFEGWGGEDVEFLFRARARRLFPGRLMPALHLWHPPADGKSQQHPNLRLAADKISDTVYVE